MNTYKIKLTIFKHIIRLQAVTGNRLSDSEYARQIGVTRQAFASLMKGQTVRIDSETIEKLLNFFDRTGMPLTVGDLYETTVQPAT